MAGTYQLSPERVRRTLELQLEKASKVEQLLPLLSELFTIDEVKKLMDDRLDSIEDESKLRTALLRGSPLTEILPSDLIIHCLSFLDPSKMNGILMQVSKSLTAIIRNNPRIYRTYEVRIEDSPKTSVRFRRKKRTKGGTIPEYEGKICVAVEHGSETVYIADSPSLDKEATLVPIETAVIPWAGIPNWVVCETHLRWPLDEWKLHLDDLNVPLQGSQVGSNIWSRFEWMFIRHPMSNARRESAMIEWDSIPPAGVTPSPWFESYDCEDTGFVWSEGGATSSSAVTDGDDDSKTDDCLDSIVSVSEDVFNWSLLFEVPWSMNGKAKEVASSEDGLFSIFTESKDELSWEDGGPWKSKIKSVSKNRKSLKKDKKRKKSLSPKLNSILSTKPISKIPMQDRYYTESKSPASSMTMAVEEMDVFDEAMRHLDSIQMDMEDEWDVFAAQYRTPFAILTVVSQKREELSAHIGKAGFLQKGMAYIKHQLLNADKCRLYIPPEPREEGKTAEEDWKDTDIDDVTSEKSVDMPIPIEVDYEKVSSMSSDDYVSLIRSSWDYRTPGMMNLFCRFHAMRNARNYAQNPRIQELTNSSEKLLVTLKRISQGFHRKSDDSRYYEFIAPSVEQEKFDRNCERMERWKKSKSEVKTNPLIIGCLSEASKSIRSLSFDCTPPNFRIKDYPFPLPNCIHLSLNSPVMDQVSVWLNTTVNFPRLIALELCGLATLCESGYTNVSDELAWLSGLHWSSNVTQQIDMRRFESKCDGSMLISTILDQCKGLKLLTLRAGNSSETRTRQTKSWSKSTKYYSKSRSIFDEDDPFEEKKNPEDGPRCWVIPSTVEFMFIDIVPVKTKVDFSQCHHLTYLRMANVHRFNLSGIECSLAESSKVECLQLDNPESAVTLGVLSSDHQSGSSPTKKDIFDDLIDFDKSDSYGIVKKKNRRSLSKSGLTRKWRKHVNLLCFGDCAIDLSEHHSRYNPTLDEDNEMGDPVSSTLPIAREWFPRWNGNPEELNPCWFIEKLLAFQYGSQESGRMVFDKHYRELCDLDMVEWMSDVFDGLHSSYFHSSKKSKSGMNRKADFKRSKKGSPSYRGELFGFDF